MGRCPDWSFVFGCNECPFLTTMCPTGCGSRCRPGHSADCKETIGSCNHWDQLDALPAKLEGAAHLLPNNTLVSAPRHPESSSDCTSTPAPWISSPGGSMRHWLVLFYLFILHFCQYVIPQKKFLVLWDNKKCTLPSVLLSPDEDISGGKLALFC